MKNRKVITERELVQKVSEHVNQLLRENLYELKLNQRMTERLLGQKRELRDMLKNAGTGDFAAKEYLIAFIQECLLKLYAFTEESILDTFFFCEEGQQNVGYQFDVLLYKYERKYGQDALEKMIEEYHLLSARLENNEITEGQIKGLYRIDGGRLSFIEKLELLSRKVYAAYKGLGVIDEIRDMKIDGVSGGVSGKKEDYHSVWIFYHGRSIHLSFLDFGSEEELERICRNLCRYRQPGEISKKKGYLIHEMADHARVVVARPDFAENWLFFVRKLDNIKVCRLQELVTDSNASLPLTLLKWLMKGCQVTGITGMQGCGKTTLLMALVEEIPAEYTIRVLELAFELHLRERYEKRNIVTFRETASIDGFEGLEVQKKTDGAVSIIGEVAGAKVAAWMIESGQSGSLFSLFTHHAKTTKSLVYSLRNSLLKEGHFQSEQIALSQVTEVVRFDVHLHMDRSGHRYIERISEIIPIEEEAGFKVQDLIVFEQGCYTQKNKISEATRNEMAAWMTDAEREDFFHADI